MLKAQSNLTLTYIIHSLTWTMNYQAVVSDDSIRLIPMAIVSNTTGEVVKGDVSLCLTPVLDSTYEHNYSPAQVPPDVTPEDACTDIVRIGETSIDQDTTFIPIETFVLSCARVNIIDVHYTANGIMAQSGYQYRVR